MESSNLRIIHLLEKQGFRELVSAHLFAAGVLLAPTLDDKHFLAEHAQEELSHFEHVSVLHEKLSQRSLFDVIQGRAAEVPVPSTWLEAAIAGYLVDRAAATQLRAYTNLGDKRLEALVREIQEHEHEHQLAAETALRDQARDHAGIADAGRPHVAKWFRIALSVLDGPDGPDAERVAAAFVASIRDTLAACGLSVPDGAGSIA